MKDDKTASALQALQTYGAAVMEIGYTKLGASITRIWVDEMLVWSTASTPPSPAQWAVWLTMKKWLLDCGYCRVSRRYGVLTRIDREDWLDVCLMHLCHDEEIPDFNYEDFYRRVLSKDRIDVSKYVSEMIPNSSSMKTGFRPKVEQPPEVLLEIVKIAERMAKRRKP